MAFDLVQPYAHLRTAAPPSTVRRHESELGWWEIVSREPHPALRPYVRGYEGYREQARGFRWRLEVPWAGVVTIINFGDPYRIAYPRKRRAPGPVRSFTAGLHHEPVLVSSEGLQQGIQVNFSPLGASMFFGCSMDELANHTISLDAVLGPAVDRLAERLADLPDWETRFALLDGVIARRLLDAATPPAGVAWAWRELVRTNGAVSIGSLTETLGWSRKQLVARFRERIGLPPKAVARVLRFERAVRLLEQGERRPIDVAMECGYYDQAHLNREFLEFTGQSPGAYVARQLPAQGGYLGD